MTRHTGMAKPRVGRVKDYAMNTSVSYLGMSLKNPIVTSASPLAHTLDSMRRVEDAGASTAALDGSTAGLIAWRRG